MGECECVWVCGCVWMCVCGCVCVGGGAGGRGVQEIREGNSYLSIIVL